MDIDAVDSAFILIGDMIAPDELIRHRVELYHSMGMSDVAMVQHLLEDLKDTPQYSIRYVHPIKEDRVKSAHHLLCQCCDTTATKEIVGIIEYP